jgi:hypothetical protein
MESITVTVDLTADEVLIITLLAMLGTATMSHEAPMAARLIQEIMDETTPGPDEARSGIEKLAASLNASGRGLLTLIEPRGEVS